MVWLSLNQDKVRQGFSQQNNCYWRSQFQTIKLCNLSWGQASFLKTTLKNLIFTNRSFLSTRHFARAKLVYVKADISSFLPNPSCSLTCLTSPNGDHHELNVTNYSNKMYRSFNWLEQTGYKWDQNKCSDSPKGITMFYSVTNGEPMVFAFCVFLSYYL